jgi:uncharacterized lipoprotein YajG
MRRTSLLVVLAMLVGAAFLIGCAARPEVMPGAPPPTPVVRVGDTVDGRGTDERAAELASRFPLAAPPSDTQDVALDNSQCIACHTDEEAVKALAVEPEEEEELSEGEG